MERISFEALSKDGNADAAIIGGGFCGLLTAFLLIKEGRKVAVFEKDGFFSKKRLPDLLQYDAERSLSALKNKYGYPAALGYYRAASEAVGELKNVADEVGLEAAVKDVFTFSDGGASYEKVAEEYRLRKYGGISVELIDGKSGIDLFSFPFEVGLYSPKGGLCLDKREFCEKLLCWLSVKGAELYENTRVDCVTQSDGAFTVETSEEKKVTATTVFDCRGEELLSRYSFLGRREAVFYIRTEPQNDFCGWYNRAFLRDIYSKPYYFIPDGLGRVTVSGADFPSFKKKNALFDAIFAMKTKTLEKTLAEYFYPLAAEVCDRGCSSYLRTKTVLPASGADPLRRGYFYLTSGNKNTLLSAWLAAKSAVGKYLCRDGEEYSLLGI